MNSLETIIENSGLRKLSVYRDNRLILCLPAVNRIPTVNGRFYTEIFDMIEEALEFIKNREQHCRRSYSLHLILRAYEFDNEH